jgi:N utilization substance protein A
MTRPPSDHWAIVHRLLAREVPEVASGTIELRAIARAPGLRTKLAVSALTAGLDPVSACVGPRAERITAVRLALGGERIDVLPWSDDPERLVKLALAPAPVRSVELDWPRHRATAFVPNDKYEFARGENAVNQTLASELTGWTVEVAAF